MSTIHPAWLLVTTLLLAGVPLVLGLATSYLKMSIVLGMLRNALGAQQVPSTMVVMALSLALTAHVMAPMTNEIVRRTEELTLPKLIEAPSIETLTTLGSLAEPWREFLLRHTGERELHAVIEMRIDTRGEGSEPSLRELLTAFMLSELKRGFIMGFMLLVPFLVIDLVIANVLAGLGMMMVSPTLISLPLKLILFVIADGWLLLAKGLILSYGGEGV